MLLDSGPKECATLEHALEFISALKCSENLMKWTLVCEVETGVRKIMQPVVAVILPFLRDVPSLYHDIELIVGESCENLSGRKVNMKAGQPYSHSKCSDEFDDQDILSACFDRSLTDSHLQVHQRKMSLLSPISEARKSQAMGDRHHRTLTRALTTSFIAPEDNFESRATRDDLSSFQSSRMSHFPLRTWKSHTFEVLSGESEQKLNWESREDELSRILLGINHGVQSSTQGVKVEDDTQEQLQQLLERRISLDNHGYQDAVQGSTQSVKVEDDTQEQLRKLLERRISLVKSTLGGASHPLPSSLPTQILRNLSSEETEQLRMWGVETDEAAEEFLQLMLMSPKSLPRRCNTLKSATWDSPSPKGILQRAKSDPTGLGARSSVGFSFNVNNDVSEIEDQDKPLSVGYKRVPDMTYEEISQYFNLPISEACTKLKVGLTVLKKKCRELGIPRWPYRKLKSLDHLINTIQDMAAGPETNDVEGVQSAIVELESQRKAIHDVAATELAEETRRLRQACFKATYKRRREVTGSPLDSSDDL